MKKSIINITFLLILLSLLLLSGCKDSSMKEDGIYAVINTDKGKVICKLLYDKAPIAVGNFIGLSEGKIEYTKPPAKDKIKKPFYNGLTFHVVIKGKVILGGDPTALGNGGPGYEFADEFAPDLTFDSTGILAMENNGAPNTNGSRFLITLAPFPQIDGKYVIFGKVVSGLDTINLISELKVNEAGKPIQPAFIKDIKIVRVGKNAKEFDAMKAFASSKEKIKKQDEERQKKMEEFLKTLNVDYTKFESAKVGYKFFITKQGSGRTPKKGDKISANYALYLQDGTKLQSSFELKQPFETEIGIGKVIPGWDEAFITMKEGERRILILPSYLAYGDNGYPPAIPPKATLIFDVELIKIVN